MNASGRISIVGAGPGDAELITIRGLRRVQQCDVLVYDRLVHPDLIDQAPRRAERIFVGKAAGWAAAQQREIESLLIRPARAGKRVVRLKGGDPFVFGRGAEELLAGITAGVPVELVPGISSAIGVPALAGIPVTHRCLSSAFTVVTGHHVADLDIDWLAKAPGTIVVLMGLTRLDEICDELVAAGKDAQTPAAVIADGATESERVIVGSLSTLPRAAATACIDPPAVIVIGEVVSLHDPLYQYIGQVAVQTLVEAAS